MQATEAMKTDDGVFITEDASVVVMNGQAYKPGDPGDIQAFTKLVEKAQKTDTPLEIGVDGKSFKPSDPNAQEEIFKAELRLKHGATETQAEKAWAEIHKPKKPSLWERIWGKKPEPTTVETTSQETTTVVGPTPGKTDNTQVTKTETTTTQKPDPQKTQVQKTDTQKTQPAKAKTETTKVQNKAPDTSKTVAKKVAPKQAQGKADMGKASKVTEKKPVRA